jgi:quercetin dioxygenase-like cupin family protein
MDVHKVHDYVNGWFVGDFSPTALHTTQFELAMKRYETGDTEPAHVHHIATEITLVTSGRVSMNETEYATGEFAIVPPGEIVTFTALEDSTTVVLKTPSVPDDKHLTTVDQ